MNSALSTLVTAAKGKTGRRIAQKLEALGVPTRHGSRSGTPRFDWDDATSWAPALEGIEAVYIAYSPDLAVPAALETITRFTALAREKGVQRLVLLSGRGEEAAQRCERVVQNSGLEWTIIRASWFAQNFDEGDFHDLVLSGLVTLPAADTAREPFIDIEDIADVAVAALTEDRHQGELYEVTGPSLMTFAEATAEIAAASGREVEFQSIPMPVFSAGLTQAGVPTPHVELLEYLFGTVLDGRNERVTDGVERALGRPARTFQTYAREAFAAGAWRPEVAATDA